MVGKSKVISGLATHQAHRRRKDTVMGSQVSANTYGQYRDPKGTIGELFQPSFQAGLTNNDTGKTPGGNFLPATALRASSAPYVDVNGILRIAGENESRQEYSSGQALGTLMESDGTNKSANYNANPDDALTNIVPAGPGTVSAIDDAEKLREAGLSNVCTDGRVFAVDARGVGTTFCYVDGDVDNTNVHTISAYCRVIQGTGFIGLSDGTSGIPIPGSQTEYGRLITTQTPDAANRRFLVSANSDSLIYFVLNKLEESPVPSSTIITQGAAGVRALDQLSWPLTDAQGNNILNKTQGMCAILWRPGFSSTDLPSGTVTPEPILSFDDNIIYWEKITNNSNRFRSNNGANAVFSPVTGELQNGQTYLVPVVWSGTSVQIGHKIGGTWVWSVSGTYNSWADSGVMNLRENPTLPAHARSLYLWDENKGTAWLESFFSGVAN